jgi:glutaredoxin
MARFLALVLLACAPAYAAAPSLDSVKQEFAALVASATPREAPAIRVPIVKDEPEVIAAATPTAPVFAMRDGYTVSVLTAADCIHCGEAKKQVAASGVPVEYVDADRDGREVLRLWQGSSKKLGVPAYVLCRDGEPVARWTGLRDATQVREIATYTPRVEVRGETTRTRRTAPVAAGAVGSSAAPALSNGIVLAPGERLIAIDGVPVGEQQAKVYGPGLGYSANRAMPYVQPEPAPVRRSVPPARRQWSYSGQGNPQALAAHLRSHGIDPTGMSYQDMINAHSHAHEGTWGSVQGRGYASNPAIRQRAFLPSRPVARVVTAPFRLFGRASGGCPGGACPR